MLIVSGALCIARDLASGSHRQPLLDVELTLLVPNITHLPVCLSSSTMVSWLPAIAPRSAETATSMPLPLLAAAFQASSIFPVDPSSTTYFPPLDTHARTHSIHRLPPSNKLIPPIQFNLNRTPHLQRPNSRPNTPFPSQDPLLDCMLGRPFKQPQKVIRTQLRHQRQTSTRHRLIDQEAANRVVQQTQRIELAETVLDF